jgi:hypothetical protein
VSTIVSHGGDQAANVIEESSWNCYTFMTCCRSSAAGISGREISQMTSQSWENLFSFMINVGRWI